MNPCVSPSGCGTVTGSADEDDGASSKTQATIAARRNEAARAVPTVGCFLRLLGLGAAAVIVGMTGS